MAKFSKHQPKDGEIVAHCGHINAPKHHFFGFGLTNSGEPLEVDMRRPDNTTFATRFMALCDACFAMHHSTPHLAIRADAVWKGNEPVIKENFQ